MTISWLEIFSLILNVFLFVWANNERAQKKPLSRTLKGLEKSTMSHIALYDEFKKLYNEDERDSIPIEEFNAHLNHGYNYWRSQRELIIGFRRSVDPREEQPQSSQNNS